MADFFLSFCFVLADSWARQAKKIIYKEKNKNYIHQYRPNKLIQLLVIVNIQLPIFYNGSFNLLMNLMDESPQFILGKRAR